MHPDTSARGATETSMSTAARIVIVMPAYNAERTLVRTVGDLPRGLLHRVIVVDDASEDDTVAIASGLDVQLFVHADNRGYGANQKTCYREALLAEADIIVMVHPDYQYDPRLLPELIRPLQDGSADAVLGSRFLSASPLAQGMPWWKYAGNRLLTRLENAVFGLRLSELHTGYRAFRSEVLRTVPWWLNSDAFLFDQQIIAQMVARGFRIAEIPVPTRYMPEASSADVWQSLRYGVGILHMLLQCTLHRRGMLAQPWLEAVDRNTAVPTEYFARLADSPPAVACAEKK
jgi:glycosyltransferase involved in cell wall biosynthesis